jgi:hypothetical protein
MIGALNRAHASTSALVPPRSVVARRVGARTVQISWTDTNAGQASYEIQERAATAKQFRIVGHVDAGVTTFARKSAPAGTLTYRVRAFVKTGRTRTYSSFSPEVTTDTQSTTTSTSTSSSSSTSTSSSSSTTTSTTIAHGGGAAFASQFAIRSGSVDDAHSIAVDPRTGATVVAGLFTGTTTFGGTRAYTSASAGDLFVAKYDAARMLTWVTTIRSTQSTGNELGGIAFDGAGNVVVGGDFWGSADIGTTHLTGVGGRDTFVATLSVADGSTIWARGYGATRFNTNVVDDAATSVAVASDGTIAVSGLFSGTLTFGSTGAPSITSSSGGDSADGYVAEFDSTGSARWARHFDDVSLDMANDVAFDARGDLFVVGRSWASIDFGLGPMTPPAGSFNDMYLAKLSGTTGATKWAKVFSGPQDDIANAVAVGSDGNPVVVGTTYIGSGGKGADFGQGPVAGPGGMNIVVAKFAGADGSGGGHAVWVKTYGGAASESLNDVAIDASGTVAVTGSYSGTLDVGAGPTTTSASQLLLFTLASDGSFRWSRSATGATTVGVSAAIGANGTVEIAGNFAGTVDFGGGPLTSMTGTNGGSPTNIFVLARVM